MFVDGSGTGAGKVPPSPADDVKDVGRGGMVAALKLDDTPSLVSGVAVCVLHAALSSDPRWVKPNVRKLSYSQ